MSVLQRPLLGNSDHESESANRGFAVLTNPAAMDSASKQHDPHGIAGVRPPVDVWWQEVTHSITGWERPVKQLYLQDTGYLGMNSGFLGLFSAAPSE